MGLGKKLFKTVVSDNVSSLVGTNKNDVKVAKIELKKAKAEEKINEKKQIRKQQQENAQGVMRYVRSNIDVITSQLDALAEETQILVSSAESIVGYDRASRKSKQDITEKIEDNLKYLYLSKTFFSLLSKVTTGMNLADNQYIFIERFHPFFDGIKVLSEDYNNDTDDSVLGMFKEVGNEFAQVFVSNKKPFSFDDYLIDFEERANKFEIPDYKASIQLFIRTYSNNETNKDSANNEKSNNNTTNTIVCTNCNATVSNNMKFCPECGSSLAPKKSFCPECGNKCEPGMKFCPYCGNKM